MGIIKRISKKYLQEPKCNRKTLFFVKLSTRLEFFLFYGGLVAIGEENIFLCTNYCRENDEKFFLNNLIVIIGMI